MPSLFIVVPVLNEAGNMPRLFASFAALSKEFESLYTLKVVLVDDGSTDKTGETARQLSKTFDFTLLTHATNLGPGRAFATAFTYLAERLDDTDWVVTLEGDNTSRIELLRQMYLRTNEGYDVILASPYMYGGGIVNTTPFRVILSHIANAFVKEFLDMHGILTVSSFFRLYRGSALRRLQAAYGSGVIDFAGFEGMVEMLIKMVYLQTRLSEVAMVLDTKQRVGKSKMKIMKTGLGYLRLWRVKNNWRAAAEAYLARPMIR